jgi:hypothetical protein
VISPSVREPAAYLATLPRPRIVKPMQTYRCLVACLALAAPSAGCGAATPPPDKSTAPPSAAAAAPAVPALPPGQLARGQVENVLVQGPPWLLRRVPIEEVIRAGAFIGWKVLALPDSWSNIEIKPGDVITKVNGATLERPDDLFEVWKGLVTAKEIRIDYEREGAPRQLVLQIVGDPSKEVVAAFEKGGPPPPRKTATRPRGVTVIEEDDGTPPEDSR